MSSVLSGKRVLCTYAPEPEEVYWQNLEATYEHQLKTERHAYFSVAVVCIVAAGCIAFLKWLAVNYKENNGSLVMQASGHVQLEYESSVVLVYTVITLCISGVTVCTNLILKLLVLWWTKREGQDTQTEHERSIFSKLSAAYIVNCVMVPIVLGFVQSGLSSGQAIDQAWYEQDGIVYQVLVIVIINAVAVDAIKVFQPLIILNRYIVSKFVHSKAKLIRLWTPPKMHLGELYAHTAKGFGMGLIYGPLYPPVYGITAVAMLICFFATRYGIAKWYRRPASVDSYMLDRLVVTLSWVQLLGIVIAAIAANSTTSDWTGLLAAPLIATPTMWVVFAFFPVRIFKRASKSSGVASNRTSEILDHAAGMNVLSTNSGRVEVNDTGDMRHDEVPSKLKVDLSPYDCPRLMPNCEPLKLATRYEAALYQLRQTRGAHTHRSLWDRLTTSNEF